LDAPVFGNVACRVRGNANEALASRAETIRLRCFKPEISKVFMVIREIGSRRQRRMATRELRPTAIGMGLIQDFLIYLITRMIPQQNKKRGDRFRSPLLWRII
jgi:hypothetical protein